MTESNLYKAVVGVLAKLPEWEVLTGLGEEVYLVGGSVRDATQEPVLPTELDLVTMIPAAELADRIVEKLGGEVVLFDAFDTATVTTDRIVIDVARARRENYPAPGALPEVEPTDSIEEDLLRRDFTVNTLALRVDQSDGELLGAPQAVSDLWNEQLRVLHDQSFLDDPTRIFRLCRYAGRLGFRPDAHTADLARMALDAGALESLSGGRIGAELLLLVEEQTALDALSWLENLGVAEKLGLRFDQVEAARSLELVGDDERRDLILLAGMMTERADLSDWLDLLEFPAADRDLLLRAISVAPQLREQLDETEVASKIAVLVSNEPREVVVLAGGTSAERWLNELSRVRLEISGDDLIAAGLDEGPQIGRALAATLHRKLDGELSGRDEELASALSYINRDRDE